MVLVAMIVLILIRAGGLEIFAEPEPMITFDQVAIAQGNFQLENISFELPGNAYAVLMGKTGCGKTTLLEILCGLRKPTRAIVRIAGEDITRVQPGARQIGYVPQDRALFPIPSRSGRISLSPCICVAGKKTKSSSGSSPSPTVSESPRCSIAGPNISAVAKPSESPSGEPSLRAPASSASMNRSLPSTRAPARRSSLFFRSFIRAKIS